MKQDPVSKFRVFGLVASRHDGRCEPNPNLHHHNEFELLFLVNGAVSHEHGGRVFPMPLRSLAVKWGGLPHRTFNRARGSVTLTVHVPVGEVFNWGLPAESFIHPLLRGEVFYEPNPANAAFDEAAMNRWFCDINAPADPLKTPFRRKALMCEIQARLLRLVLDDNAVRPGGAADENAPGSVARMLQCVTERYRDPALDVDAIARHAGISRHHACEHFRKACGVSLMQYVTRQRVTHAQCLLSAGGAKILDVAFESGFGSASRFHQVFRAATGATPREYARNHGHDMSG